MLLFTKHTNICLTINSFFLFFKTLQVQITTKLVVHNNIFKIFSLFLNYCILCLQTIHTVILAN